MCFRKTSRGNLLFSSRVARSSCGFIRGRYTPMSMSSSREASEHQIRHNEERLDRSRVNHPIMGLIRSIRSCTCRLVRDLLSNPAKAPRLSQTLRCWVLMISHCFLAFSYLEIKDTIPWPPSIHIWGGLTGAEISPLGAEISTSGAEISPFI